MKLYFTPGTCSLASHIALVETGLPFTKIRVDLREKKTESGADYMKVNPKGYVPALELADGRIITEGVVILGYIADQAPSSNLAPAQGSFERLRLNEWLAYVSSEIHKSYSPMFDKALDDSAKKIFSDKLKNRYAFIDQTLAKQKFLGGDLFSIADAYLYTVTRWAKHLNVAVSQYTNLMKWFEMVGERESVKTALANESAKS